AYWLPALQKSYREAPGPHTLCVTLRMPHGHEAGWAPKELYAFADAILKGGVPLPRITAQGRDGENVWVGFESETAVERAELLYTKGSDDHWPDREWFVEPAQLQNGRATAALPEGATVWFINLVDERGLTVSSEHEEL
ncbi:MAG: dipeptidyl aminopeptidase, partial [Armatimonadetes bacterium]|nr:dipeptidyl aminopeptidase [Armatimonadota bacterium]